MSEKKQLRAPFDGSLIAAIDAAGVQEVGQAPATAHAAGATEHLFNEANEDELAVLMFSVERGDTPGASRVARRILSVIAAAAKSRPVAVGEVWPYAKEALPAALAPSAGPLSPREMQVLQLLSRGLSNGRIADALSRSAKTIDTQIKSIYRKLDVNSRTQAVNKAMKLGLLRWDRGNPQ